MSPGNDVWFTGNVSLWNVFSTGSSDTLPGTLCRLRASRVVRAVVGEAAKRLHDVARVRSRPYTASSVLRADEAR